MADEDLDFDEPNNTSFMPAFLLSANLDTTDDLHANKDNRRQQNKRLKKADAYNNHNDEQSDGKKIYSERLRRFGDKNTDSDLDEDVTLHHKLPVKLRDGKWHQVVEKKRTIKPTQPDVSTEENVAGEIPTNIFHKTDWRRLLAVKCTSIMAEPQNVKSMDELRHLQSSLEELLNMQQSNQKNSEFAQKIDLILASLAELYKDIIPGYRIRAEGESDESAVAEKGGKQLRKETKKLQEVEFALLSNYADFLRVLETQFQSIVKRKAAKTLPSGSAEHALLAVQCMSNILLAHPHFNYRQNIVNLICELAVAKFPLNKPLALEINGVCARTLRELFRKDVLGDVVLEAVTYMAKIARNSNGKKLTPILVETMLAISIDEDHRAVLEAGKTKNHDEKLSLKEKKRRKRIAMAEKDLRATKAENDRKLRARFQSQVLTQMFAVYFRVLKAVANEKSNKRVEVLLAPVLRGVAKFGLMINIEFYDNLFQLLDTIMKTSTSLEPQHKMWCVLAVFRLLSGRGTSLQIDPQRFYQHLLDACDKLAENLQKNFGKSYKETKRGLKKFGKNRDSDITLSQSDGKNYDAVTTLTPQVDKIYDSVYVSQCIVALIQCTRYAYISRRKSIAFEQSLKLCGRLLKLATVLNQINAETSHEQYAIAVMLNVRELSVSFPRLGDVLSMRDENTEKFSGSSKNGEAEEDEFEVLETATPCFTVGIYNTIKVDEGKRKTAGGAVGEVLKTLRVLASESGGSSTVKKLALFLSNPEGYRQHLPPQLRTITAAEWLRKSVRSDVVRESLLVQIK